MVGAESPPEDTVSDAVSVALESLAFACPVSELEHEASEPKPKITPPKAVHTE
jgi:hypothetical protein